MMICSVVGARPNFMKIAPVVLELKRRGADQIMVHTGQHYDDNMSRIFFEELGMPEPDIYLGVGSDSHARQTARIMIEFERVCEKRKPDLVIVGGDVNSTLAVSLVSSKLGIPIAHVEAGLRSFDRTMPEEINRIVTDHLSTFLFTTEQSARVNLIREGLPEASIYHVGNCMVDSLLKHVGQALEKEPWKDFSLDQNQYGLLTLHRPSNVDGSEVLRSIMEAVNDVSRHMPILFPVHPRTRERLGRFGIHVAESVMLCDPLPYLSFLGLMARARFVMTDSGGIQEETTTLHVPCLTLRWNTERPVTIQNGTNRLVGTDTRKIQLGIQEILAGKWPTGDCPELWDGKAAVRVVDAIESWSVGNL